jgi:hypothetical protein
MLFVRNLTREVSYQKGIKGSSKKTGNEAAAPDGRANSEEGGTEQSVCATRKAAGASQAEARDKERLWNL